MRYFERAGRVGPEGRGHSEGLLRAIVDIPGSGDRLRRPIVMATTEKHDEISVTPAMVAVGVAYFARSIEGRFPDDWLLAESFVTDLYREIERVSRDHTGS
jgi:hypothetical protein